jgi:hypothetical protein
MKRIRQELLLLWWWREFPNLRRRLCRLLFRVEHLADVLDRVAELLIEHALDAHLHRCRRAGAAAARS